MLKAIHRVLRPDGRLAFHTIEPVDGLSAADKRRVVAAGPPAVSVRTSYPSLLASAGFHGVRSTDLTEEYSATHGSWNDATTRHESDLRDTVGAEEFDNRTEAYRQTRRALDDGLLLRVLYTATR